MRSRAQLICRLCGQEHGPIRLAPGEKALCVRCDAVLAQGSRLGPDSALVFSLTGLILAVPAMTLPFVGADKFGDERVSLLFTGVVALWDQGMRALSVLVFLCGGLLPILLLTSLAMVHASGWLRLPTTGLWGTIHLARHFEEWSIPEVQVLAVIVALMKLGSVVHVTIGPGFWCYCAMTLSLVIALSHFDYEPSGPLAASGAHPANPPP